MPRAYVEYYPHSRGIHERRIMRKPHRSTVISVIVVFVLVAVMLLLNRASIGRAMKDM